MRLRLDRGRSEGQGHQCWVVDAGGPTAWCVGNFLASVGEFQADRIAQQSGQACFTMIQGDGPVKWSLSAVSNLGRQTSRGWTWLENHFHRTSSTNGWDGGAMTRDER